MIIYLYFKRQKGKNLTEIISFYFGLISIPVAIYLNNRPYLNNISYVGGLSIFEIFYIIFVVIVLIVGLILWKRKMKNEYFGEY